MDIPTRSQEFSEKRVLVTGGTRGAGAAIVARFAAVLASDRAASIRGTEVVLDGGTVPTVRGDRGSDDSAGRARRTPRASRR